jgi:Zn-dependent M28 family amino/carboxypeptidase
VGRYFLFLSFLLFSGTCLAQKADTVALRFSRSITADELKAYLYILSDSGMEGREMGTAGQKMAADFLASMLAGKIEIPPIVKQADGSTGYYQEFPIPRPKKEKLRLLQVDSFLPVFLKDYFSYQPTTDLNIISDTLIFLGYGIHSKKYSDFRKPEQGSLKGKVVMILGGEPQSSKGKFYARSSRQPGAVYADPVVKREALMKYQPAAIIIVEKYFASGDFFFDSTKHAETSVPEFHISRELADSFLKRSGTNISSLQENINKKGKSIRLQTPVRTKISWSASKVAPFSENVVGFVEGSDLKDEIVVVSAHYDHLGVKAKGIYFGANDNASGTSALLEIAEAFNLAKQAGKGPRRSILFLFMSGEEKGLLGSEYYSTHPIFPLSNTVANLNVDMVGRKDSLHEHSGYIYVIGADRISKELHDLNERVAKTYTNVKMDYKYNDPEDPNRFYYRSDHYNFARYGIPVIFYFNGMHADYHKPTDTPDKVDPLAMELISRHIFFTAWEIANLSHRLEINKE